jgi:hypothetical protein
MTARKSFKRLVRERAARTGESYTAALRHFRESSAENDPMEKTGFRRVAKTDLGFALHVPDDWKEQPPNPASPLEVAHFSFGQGSLTGVCLVLWSSTRTGFTPRAQVESMIPQLESQGFREFVLSDVSIASRSAVRMDCERRRDGKVWSVRGYLVFAEQGFLSLALATHDLDRDRQLFDRIADGFELLERLDQQRMSVGDMALGRYGPKARAVVRLAESAAIHAGHPELRGVHIVAGLVEEAEGTAGKVLRSLGVTSARVAGQLAGLGRESDPGTSRTPVVDRETSRLLSEACPAHAAALGSSLVQTEHLLLGIMTERDAGGWALLEALGVGEGELRDRLADGLETRIESHVRSRA